MIDLNKIYNNGYKKRLNKHYIDLFGKRTSNFIKYGIIYLCFSLIPSVLFIIYIPSSGYKFLLIFLYNVIILISYFVNVRYVNKKEYRKMNERIACDFIYFLNGKNKFFYKNKLRLKEEVFKNIDIFNFDILKYNGCNFVSIPYKNSKIICSDVNLFVYRKVVNKKRVTYNNRNYIRTTTRKVKDIIFNGFYIELKLSKVCDSYIYLVPNNINDKYLSSYINYKGERVILEDINFNKKYSVYSSDQIKSRYILSISLMDKINKLDTIIPNKKYIVFKDDSTVGIFINDFSFNDILDINVPIKRNDMIEFEYLKKVYDKVSIIFSIYDILDLNNDIYNIKN